MARLDLARVELRRCFVTTLHCLVNFQNRCVRRKHRSDQIISHALFLVAVIIVDVVRVVAVIGSDLPRLPFFSAFEAGLDRLAHTRRGLAEL